MKTQQKTVYLTNQTLVFYQQHCFTGETVGKFFHRLITDYPLLEAKAQRAELVAKELNTIKKLINQVLSQQRIYLDLFNTTLHAEDYATLFTVEDKPEDIVRQAFQTEEKRKQKYWIQKYHSSAVAHE